MRIVFADTAYWIATTNPRDFLHGLATELTIQLGEHRIITSEMVLVEVLTRFAPAELISEVRR